MTQTPIAFTRAAAGKTKPKDEDLTFGTVFTDHMFIARWDEGQGWHDARIEPYKPFAFDPAMATFHYAQAVFDGLKAFRGKDSVIRLFRPQRHAERMANSCARMCIPPPDKELILRSFRELVAVDHEWVPSKRGTALYLRPFAMATEPFLGVRPAKQYVYCLFISPVGAYYPEGIKPVKILVTDQHVRAVAGGIGDVKASANYAASLYAAEEAKKQGYTQVLWLDGKEHRYLNEVGTMNIMLKIGDEIITPPLDGSILAGVTRDSALALMRNWGLKVSERPIAIEDVMKAADDGSLKEMWGTGTAAVISPVGTLGYKGRDVLINKGEVGPLTQRLYDAITAIQYGETNDAFHWTDPVTPAGPKSKAAAR